MKSALQVLLLGLAAVLGTTMLGWWSLPLVGAGWGWLAAGQRRPGLMAALSAALAWGILLAWMARQGPLLSLADRLGAVFYLPGPVFIALNLLVAASLTGLAAYLAGRLRERSSSAD